MQSPGKLSITTPSEREVMMTRTFNAPRALVFDAWTKPELLSRWLGIFAGWTMAECQIDLRVGGRYRFVWRNTDGSTMVMGGKYREIVTPERLVSTESFEEPWYPGEGLNTLVLEESDGRTTCILTSRYDSQEIRDAVLASGAADGVAAGYDKLDEVLSSMLAHGAAPSRP
jgi:uncharacterized protein YndB with AHSA1/START domain